MEQITDEQFPEKSAGDDFTSTEANLLKDKINEAALIIGEEENLNTTEKSNLVAAINEVLATVGGVGSLTSEDINTLEKLNAILNDADVASETFVTELTGALSGVLSKRGITIQSESPFSSLIGDLDAGVSTSLLLLGDSTGNATDEWLYLLLVDLLPLYPNHSFKYHSWDKDSEVYGNPVYLQGTGSRYASLTGVNGSKLTLTKQDFGNVLSDLEVKVKLRASDYTPAANTALIGTFGGAGQRGWYFFIEAVTGNLKYCWTTDGSALNYATSTVAPSGLVDNTTDIWFRFVHDLDNGSSGNTVTFYTSTNGTTWTILGSPVVTAGVTTIFQTTHSWEIGMYNVDREKFTGRIYEAYILDGGLLVSPASIDSWLRSTDLVSFAGNPVLNIYNGSHGGAGIDFLNIESRFKKMAPLDNYATILLSVSHNDGLQKGSAYLTHWDTYLTLIRGKLKTANIILSTQNPRKSPAPWIEEHAKRMGELKGWANRNHLSIVDVYSEFLKGNLNTLINVDGIHPDPLGSRLWADVMFKVMFNNE